MRGEREGRLEPHARSVAGSGGGRGPVRTRRPPAGRMPAPRRAAGTRPSRREPAADGPHRPLPPPAEGREEPAFVEPEDVAARQFARGDAGLTHPVQHRRRAAVGLRRQFRDARQVRPGGGVPLEADAVDRHPPRRPQPVQGEVQPGLVVQRHQVLAEAPRACGGVVRPLHQPREVRRLQDPARRRELAGVEHPPGVRVAGKGVRDDVRVEVRAGELFGGHVVRGDDEVRREPLQQAADRAEQHAVRVEDEHPPTVAAEQHVELRQRRPEPRPRGGERRHPERPPERPQVARTGRGVGQQFDGQARFPVPQAGHAGPRLPQVPPAADDHGGVQRGDRFVRRRRPPRPGGGGRRVGTAAGGGGGHAATLFSRGVAGQRWFSGVGF